MTCGAQKGVWSQGRKGAEIVTLAPSLRSIGINEGVKCARDKIMVNNKTDSVGVDVDGPRSDGRATSV